MLESILAGFHRALLCFDLCSLGELISSKGDSAIEDDKSHQDIIGHIDGDCISQRGQSTSLGITGALSAVATLIGIVFIGALFHTVVVVPEFTLTFGTVGSLDGAFRADGVTTLTTN